MAALEDWKRKLIALMITRGALLFDVQKGFVLKSGRRSPYFFNVGLLLDGQSQIWLGRGYARVLDEVWNDTFDLLYGPAYKGIVLAGAAAAGCHKRQRRPIQFAYNRKEAKKHGEGGLIVGPPMRGRRVIVVDDVITAGTAFRESATAIEREGGILDGLVVILDRQEKGQSVVGEGLAVKDTDVSAIQQVRAEYGIKVASILTLNDLISYLMPSSRASSRICDAVRRYREKYGVAD